jgi:hypothetical protein
LSHRRKAPAGFADNLRYQIFRCRMGVAKPIAEFAGVWVFSKQGHDVIPHKARPRSAAAPGKMAKTPFENEMGQGAKI